MSRRTLTRRSVLRGVGAAMGLPLLDAMGPWRAMAADGATPAAAPLRMAFMFIPNGAIMQNWQPTKFGADFELPATLKSLEAHRKELLVLSGLTHDKARANGDGPGDHARSAAAFLTGAQPYKTAGRDIRAGISVDQLAAEHLGKHTRLPSLELGTEHGAQAGNCDSGYSCAYSSNISWRTPGSPMAKEIDPRAVFSRLFGDATQAKASQERAKEASLRQSVLDLVREDAARLRKTVGAADQVKMDEYLDSVRMIEKRLQDSEKQNAVEVPGDAAIPDGVPREFADHIRLMMDMLVLALRTDSTRVATFMFANEGSNRSFADLGVREGHHELSHHGYDAKKMELISRIDAFYVEQFAYLLGQMRSVKEGDGSLLDHSMIVYGAAIADGHRHAHDDLPVLLAGRGNGAVTPGRHVRYSSNTPMCNLYLSMLDSAGAPQQDRFGDSTGRLGQLTA